MLDAAALGVSRAAPEAASRGGINARRTLDFSALFTLT